MAAMILVGMLMVLAVVFCIVLSQYHKADDALKEQCEVCGKWIPYAKAVIISEVFTDDARLGDGQAFGYTGISASYCRKHAPKNANVTA